MGDLPSAVLVKALQAHMLSPRAPTKPAASLDQEIAALRANEPGRDNLDVREAYEKKLTDLYRLKYGSQKLKSW